MKSPLLSALLVLAFIFPYSVQEYMQDHKADVIGVTASRDALYSNAGAYIKTMYYISVEAEYNDGLLELKAHNWYTLAEAKELMKILKRMPTLHFNTNGVLGDFPKELQ